MSSDLRNDSRKETRYIGLTVDSIRKTHYTTVLNTLVREQIILLDDQIKKTIERGFNELTFELPSTFELLHFEKNEAQLALYSELISVCDEKGFKTTIELGPKSYLKLKWPSAKLSEQDCERRRNLLNSRRG